MWSFYHISTFLLTFTSYAFFHAARKTFSNVKSTISSEWSSTQGNVSHCNKPDELWHAHDMFESSDHVETYLGVLDALFMVSYAVGLYISGFIGDRYELRKVLSFGMCSSAVSVFVFGCVLEWNQFYNKYLYAIVWITNGLLQSTGWPTVVAIMGNWFGKSSHGLVLGVWSACASIGNIFGAVIVSQVLPYGYDFAFLVTSSVLFAGGIVNFFGLVDSPKELGLKSPDSALQQSDVQITVTNREYTSDMDDCDDQVPDAHIAIMKRENASEIEDGDDDAVPLLESFTEELSNQKAKEVQLEKALGFWKALLLPGVLLYAFAYFCLKLVNYSFFFWLPYYLHDSYGWSESMADKMSVWYDVGGVVGGTAAGVISDCFHKRSVTVTVMLVLSIPAVFGYSRSPKDILINAVLMTITGFFIGGVANLISAAISADLGKQGPIQGNKAALATVTGIVDGTGSVGAALGQILVPVLQQRLGWQSVFYLFVIMILLTIFCILPLFVKETSDFLTVLRRRFNGNWKNSCVHSCSQTSTQLDFVGEDDTSTETEL